MLEKRRILDSSDFINCLRKRKTSYHDNYLAMYSSWLGGFVTDPMLMVVPVDDHIVHRGDGIFEAFKCVDGNIYLLNRHLDRLEYSARITQLPIPVARHELVDIICQTVKTGRSPNCMVRVFVSRGPGGFTTDPYECPETQLYIIVTSLKSPPEELYQKGASLKTSHIPIKQSYFANVKSCNYLPNTLMHKEAVDAGVNFTVSVDERGFLGEGSTANIGILSQDGALLVPKFHRILRGTTVTRVLELAQDLVSEGKLSRVAEADISPQQAYEAREVMMFGTTIDVVPIITFDGHRIGGGVPGPLARILLELLKKDQHLGEGVLTPVWDKPAKEGMDGH